MYRAQPKASKLLSAKWQEKDHQIHLKKLKDIKSALNVKRPASYNHLKTKPKKNQMLEGKYTLIFLLSFFPNCRSSIDHIFACIYMQRGTPRSRERTESCSKK